MSFMNLIIHISICCTKCLDVVAIDEMLDFIAYSSRIDGLNMP